MNCYAAHRFQLFIAFVLLPFFNWAQSDTSTYKIIMNDGSRFNCKILEVKKGEYLKLRKDDGTIVSLDWQSFKDYQNVSQAIKIKKQNEDQREQRRSDKLKSKHSDWNNCLIVTLRGDTIRAKIRDLNKADVFAPLDLSHGRIGADYSVIKGGIIVQSKVIIAHSDETEEEIPAENFKELYVPAEDSAFRKYVSLAPDSEYPDRRIYRVITDGKCKLLFNQIEGGGSGGSSVSLNRYYVYCNGKLTKLREENLIVFSLQFRKKCSEIFTECPELVSKINDKKYKSIDLRQIVKEFNECIENKGQSGIR
jgi:hypothetical protein